MIECLNCGYLSHSGFEFKDGKLSCPNCGSNNLDDDEYMRGFINE